MEKIRILLVDDYEPCQILIFKLLKKNGFEDIIIVKNGEEALSLMEIQTFDVIIMDMQMPVMNGFETIPLIRMKEGCIDLPIISISPFIYKDDVEKCISIGATDFVPKPIEASSELFGKIKYHYKEHQLKKDSLYKS